MSFWTPDIEVEDVFKRGEYILIWRLSLVTGFLFILLSINFVQDSLPHFLTYLFSFFISFGAIVALYFSKNSYYVYLIACFAGTIVVSFNFLYLTDIYQIANVLWKVFLIALAFFGLNKKWALFFFIINGLTFIYYSFYVVDININSIPEYTTVSKFSLAVELIMVTFLITYVIFQFVKIHEFSYNKLLDINKELINQNKTIEQQNLENKTLVKEIHHRVKNNLQIIISLLRLQKSEMKSVEVKEQLSHAISRIMVMSLIHNKLYVSTELESIEYSSYIQDLAEEIKFLFEDSNETDIQVDINVDKIGLKTIIPLGLLINELVTNSLKHAFLSAENSKIMIEVNSVNDNKFDFIYLDNGKWKPPNPNSVNFGTELLVVLTEQLDGEFKREFDENGTKYTFSLTNIDLE